VSTENDFELEKNSGILFPSLKFFKITLKTTWTFFFLMVSKKRFFSLRKQYNPKIGQ
jgi:hypothetical protein